MTAFLKLALLCFLSAGVGAAGVVLYLLYWWMKDDGWWGI